MDFVSLTYMSLMYLETVNGETTLNLEYSVDSSTTG